MIIGAAQIKLYASRVHSLKEKRSIVKSLCDKAHNKFNVSIAEISEQDVHQTIVLGIVCVTGTVAFASNVIDNVIKFVESNTDAEIIDVSRELR
jgi:uncharacterized protein YlxP (DUF503 family)